MYPSFIEARSEASVYDSYQARAEVFRLGMIERPFVTVVSHDKRIQTAIDAGQSFIEKYGYQMDALVPLVEKDDPLWTEDISRYATLLQWDVGQALHVPQPTFEPFDPTSMSKLLSVIKDTDPRGHVLVLKRGGDPSFEGGDYEELRREVQRGKINIEQQQLLSWVLSRQAIHSTVDTLAPSAMATSIAEGWGIGVVASISGRRLRGITGWNGTSA